MTTECSGAGSPGVPLNPNPWFLRDLTMWTVSGAPVPVWDAQTMHATGVFGLHQQHAQEVPNLWVSDPTFEFLVRAVIRVESLTDDFFIGVAWSNTSGLSAGNVEAARLSAGAAPGRYTVEGTTSLSSAFDSPDFIGGSGQGGGVVWVESLEVAPAAGVVLPPPDCDEYTDTDTGDVWERDDDWQWQQRPPGPRPPTTPPVADLCLPVDTGCCGATWADLDVKVQALATGLAQQTFVMLTGYRVGGCPVTVRPCRQSCVPPTYLDYPLTGRTGGSSGGPYLASGVWFNAVCGCGRPDCSCTEVCELLLPGEASGVTEVLLDGVVVDPALYRIDNDHRLVALGGTCWPLCQNMTADVTEDGTFAVTYTRGPAPDGLDAYAVGLLACEYAKACTGSDCRLPQGVRSIARQGVSMELAGAAGFFEDGLTGISEVDARIRYWNPYALKSPAQVWSPDIRHGRRTTWP